MVLEYHENALSIKLGKIPEIREYITREYNRLRKMHFKKELVVKY
jgi:hypothetical protein